jgi:hypothetical protein
VYNVEAVSVFVDVVYGISLVKLERIAGLWCNVYADDIESCSMVSNCCASGATKGI